MDSEEVILEDDFEEGSEEDGDPEYEFINDPPSTQASSGPASTPTSCTSSPPILGDDPASPNRGIFLSTSGQTMHIHQYSGNILTSGSGSGGKPPAIRRGPGRPRKEYSPSIRVTKDTRLIKRYRGSGGVRGVSKRKYFQSGSAVDILAQLGIHQASDGSVNFMNSSGLLQQPTAIATTTSTPTATTTSSLPSTPTQEEASTPSTAATTPTSNPPTLDPDAGIVLSGDKLMQPPEEPPYFPEKWPGKFCALCNLGERSQLGQGEMLRLELGADEVEKVPLSTTPTSDDKDSALASVDDKSPRGGPLPQLSNRRQKGLNKCKNPVMTSEYIDELEKIGHIDQLEFANLFDGAYFYVHRSCAIWSSGVTRDSSGTLSNVGTVIAQSLSRKCSFCLRHGASVICKMSCPKVFHFPCVAASGGFQIVQTYISFCKEHLGQVPLVCTEDINCRSCSGLGDVSNLMMCSMCGDHYHGTCIGVAQLPGVRAGWQCHSCRHCQICRLPDATEGRSLACEQCDKIYHAQCLRPVMTSIPKYGWKCRCCRVCSDCGSRTPGAGTSSRWHSHYTVCDSCYQQRNKGFSCPICHRAYRAAAYREMVKCNLCNKFVHNTCDSDAELSSYHTKKESNPDYEYVCPPCKQLAQNGRMVAAMRRASSIDEDSMSASQESLYTDDVEMSETGGNSCGATGGEKVVTPKASPVRDVSGYQKYFFQLNADYGLGKGKPYAATKIAKKRLGLSGFTQMGRPKGGGKFGLQKRLRYNELSRKRGPKSKMRGIFGVPGLGLQRPTSDVANKTDEEPGIENRLVLCSAKDKFVLTQDICVMCGAIGTDQEGCLIACTQCGQCYHPYCVNVKVTKVILQKGWRCLDCTVCEGCGQRNDEARLILCDECDISYHIYCMDPPLDIVPHGNWKCRWCAICQKCGTNDPGFNCSWMNSYSECGPCASQSNCPSCSDAYAEGELIIQCTQCERWLHCSCDAIRTDEEAEKCSEEGYTCVLCRPRDIPPPHLQPKLQTQTSFNRSMSGSLTTKSPDDSDIGPILALDGNHYVDGVCLSEHGLTQIKSLQLDSARKRRPKHKVNADPTIADKEAGILAAIESVVAGSSHDNSLEDVKVEPLDPKEEAEIYKDGMVWDRADASPPEGFTLYTTEQGTVVLRKKRQRNLQKLGIGGFNVRNRTLKSLNNKETFEGEDITDGMVPQWTNANSTSETSDKKKKAIRRKQKNKLIETYPSYLQEAFFGKSLLDTSKAKFESSSSDDEAKSTVSDDKTIKLSMEELKMIEAMRAKQQQQHQQMIDDQKTRQINALNSAQQSQHDSAQAGASLTLNASPLTKHSQIVPSAGNVPDQVQQTVASVKMEIMQTTSSSSMGGSANTGDGLKDILPRDLLDSDLVNTIMNEERDLNKNTDNLDEITENVGEMLPSPFNLDYVEEIFKGVLTDESQESQESLLTTSGPSTYSSTITQHSSMSQQPQIHAGNMSQTQQTMQMGMNMMGGQVDTTSSQQMQQTIHLQQSQSLGQAQQPQSTMTMTLLNQQGSGPQQGQPMQQNIIVRSATNQQHMGYPNLSYNHYNYRSNQFGPVYTEKNMSQQSQWGQPIQQSGIPSIDSALGMSVADDSLSIAATPATNNQKTSDRMRQDEILGDMATISAVLYANMNHPELKTEYPNWTDRFKQILKKWRALSTENKQPFLQKARDNRSALRMKKAQQVPSMSPKDSQVHQTSGTAASAAMLSAIASDGSSEASGGELIVQQPQQQMQSRLGVGQAQAHQQSPQQQPPQQQQHMHHHQQILEVHGNSGDGKNELDELTASTTQTNTNVHSASNNTNDPPSSNAILSVTSSNQETPPCSSSKSTSTTPTYTSSDSLSTSISSTSCATYSNYNSQNFQQHVNLVEPLFDSSVQSSNSNSQVEEHTIPTTGSSPASTMDIDLGSTTSSISSLNEQVALDDEPVKYEAITSTCQGATIVTSNGNQSGTTTASHTTSTIVHSFANAANIANSFINISNLTTSSNLNITPMAAAVLPVAQTTVPVMASVTKQSFSTNLIVSQPVTHFMKALTLGTGGAKSGIFVPNVIATNISPQFTVHHHHPPQHHAYGLHHHHHGAGGPAPNVTVNPNGNFNTNPTSGLRPGAFHGQFRPFLQHNTFSITGNIHHPVSGAIQSPILAAQLQTINQIATNQAQQHHNMNLHEQQQHGNMHQSHQNLTSGSNTIIHYPTSNIVMQQHSNQFIQHLERTSSRSQSPATYNHVQAAKMQMQQSNTSPQAIEGGRLASHQYFNINNDQQIRVLTPSEIMRTLPSLPNQDLSISYDTTPAISHQVSVNTATPTMTSSVLTKESHSASLISDKNTNSAFALLSHSNGSSSSTITTPDIATLTTTCSTPNNLTSCSSPIISAFSTKNSQTPPSTPNTTTSSTTSILHQTDQEKINAQQKTMREQEQERQWKQLQANRAREQQMQQLVIHNQGGQESSLQLQVSTHNDGNSIGPMASPSPTSRPITNFVTPSAKGRPSVLPTNVNTSGYPHSTMTRPVSVQIPRGQQQQTRMTQSPFSPQSQASQSPHDQFPSSPVPQGMDTFSRPPSEGSQQDQFILSPQANRSFGHQSPNPAPNRSPAYVGQQPSVQIPAKQIRLNIDNTGYAHAPGTPRPTASTGIMRSTVYATRPLFSGNQTSPFTSPRPSDTFQSQQTPTQPQQYQQQPQPEGNRQLRDLLQRQQMVTPNSTGMVSPQQQQQHVQSPQSQNPPPSPRWNMENVDEQPATTSQQQHQQAPDNITFRQPLPPGLTSRPQRMQLATGPVLVRPGQQQMQPQVSINNQIINTRLAQIPPELRQRMIRPQIVTSVIASNQQSQMIMTQQSNIIQPGNIMQQSQAQQHQQQFGVRKIDQYGQLIGNQGGSNQNQMQQQQQMQQSQQDQQNVALLAQKLDRIQPGNINSGGNLIDVRQATSDSSHMTGTGDSETPEIPDNVTAELEKLEQEESGGMGEVEGVGDILGGLGDDDEELLVSLTAEMGADFNILEYADPELDTLNDGEKANLLDSLELDEDSEKDDKPGKKELPEKDDGSGGQIRSTTTDITSTTNNMTQCETMHTISGNQNITLSNTMHTMQVMHQTTTQAGGHNTNMSGGTLIQQSQVSQNPQIQQQNIVLDNSQQLHQQQQQRIHQLKILQQQQQHQQHTQVHQIIPANLQQIQQQMLQKVQQAAAMGKPMQVGTQLMSNGAIGIVTANNNVQVSFPGLMNRNGQQLVTQHRLQPLRMPTAGQDHQVQQQPNQGPRMILQQQLQQQSPQINRIAIGNTQGQTQGQINQPPPPPYPGPPPPYPGSSQVPAQQTSNQFYPPYQSMPSPGIMPSTGYHQHSVAHRRSLLLQEQPLLLEDLLEQEKREQERQQITSTIANVQSNSQINPGIIDDQNYQRVTGDIFSGNTQTTSGQGLLSMQQTSQQQQLVGGTSGIKPQFLPRGLNHAQWRPTNPQQQQQQQQMPSPGTPTQVVDPSGIRRDGNGAIQLFTANLQPPPPLPPETIASEQDRQIQVTYEQWLTQQHNVLAEQLKYYETEVTKLRKVKKSLNSKQRQMRKLGSELSENDARDLAKVTSEQNIVQKQLESARKQSRQHSLVIQDYKGKQMSKMQNQMISPIGTLPGSSPAHMAPQSPITSPSPGAQQILQTTGQSPLNNQMVQSHQSPLHSPSPLMSSQSPGPTSVNSIMQSPGNQQSSMSPYNTMQPSPRIGTPLSQVDECPFSPNNPGPSPTPSIPGRLTSPQHRMGAPNMPGNRIVTSPGVSYQQQQNIMGQNQILPTAAQQQQQNRFVRPQIMAMQSDGTIRPRIVFNQQQQQQQQQQLMRQTSAGYNSPLGSPQPTINQGGGQGQGQHQMDHMHNQRTMQLVQQRHLIQRQQMLQQQQQQQQQYVKQGNTQQQQPQSPMLNQVINPPSPMARGGINQYSNTNQPMQSPVMRRPPSTGGITANSPVGSERPQSVENSPRHMYLQQHSDSGGGGNMDSSTGNAGGGGGNTHNMNNPIPLPPSFGRFGYIKLGLRGGSPMWSYGSKRMPAPAAAQNMSGDNKPMASTSSGGSGQSVRKDTHLNRISILKKKKVPGLPHDMVIKSSKAVNLSSMEYGDLEDSSNTPPESPLHVRGETKGKMTLLSQSQSTARGAGESRKGQDDIVVIDSSPDEKQRIMDYDDDNDKAVVATEVSLSSAAQSVPDTDDISVIESLAPTEFDAIVSSPLESEVTEEYVLFAPDMVVDYADSDDSMKNTSMSHLPKTTISDEDKTLELIASPGVEFVRSDDTDDDTEKDKGGQFSEEHFTTGEEDMMSMGSEIVIIGSDIKSPEEQLVSTTDVLDVILSQSSTSKDTKQTSSEPSSPHVESTSGEQFGKSVIGLATTSGAVSKKGSSILTYSSRLPVTSTLITTRPSNQMSPSTMTAVSVHKKLMKDVTQTTAIVSIGNTTISVPVLKNVPLPHNKATVCDAQSSGHKTTKGRLVAKSPISVKLPKSVITMSGHKVLSPASIVTISSLNLGQSTGHNKATVAQITHKSPSPVTVTSQSVSEKMLERLATKSSSSSLVYSKLSSLTVNQDASLPHKIFEDESVSPDSSIEHDDPDLASPEHKIDFLSDSDRVYVATESMSEDMKEVNRDKSIEDTSGDTKEATVSETNVATNKNTIEIAKEDGDESKEVKEVKNSELPKVSVEMKQKQNVIPFHVIVKSRESPRSPKLSTTNQRNISSMPQLSPLSQPTEMATNMQNVSQEVRSILSSISSSSPSVTTLSLKVDSSTNAEKTVSTEASSDAPPTVKMSSDVSNVNYESLLPLTKVEMSKTESIAPIIVKATTATATPTTYADITKVAVSDRNSPVVTNPTSGGSILVVKQLLTGNQITTSPKGQLTTKSTGNSPVSQTPGGTQSVIIAQGQQVIPNLTKIQAESQQQKDRAKSPGVVSILSNQLTGQHTRIINYSDLQYSSTQPPALVMTSRQGVISGTVVPITTSAVVSGPPTSTAIHFSGSILGATLSQPSLKSTTQSPMGGSTLLHTQLTSAPFRRSKSTEEQPAATPALIHGTKRHSVELTNVVKSEPMDTTEESTTPTSTMITPPKVSDSLSGGCKFSTMSVPPVKSEDSQNVLLKQLLQNSGSTSTPSPTPPAIASRTVPGLRAPSLGLVSSLEAQLARPALPPVPSNASQIMPPSQASTSPTPATTQTTPLCTEVNVTKSTMRTHIFMQRETSFVSKPPKSPNQQQTQQQQLSQAQTIPTSTQSFVTTVDMSAASAELKGISVKHEELDAKTTLRTFPTEPPPPYPTLSSSLDAIAPPNVVINKDMPLPVQVTTVAASFVKQSTTPPVTTNVGPPGLAVIDVKKENIIDVAAIVGVGEKNQQKAADSGTFMVPKTEFPDPMEAPPSDTTAVKTAQETALEIKKRKRREYQKSRRQMQILSKEAMSSSTKKRPRKFSKVEEDYDTFIDNLMGQLRQLPHMQILEPTLCRNFGVGSVYGTGDLSKISSVNDYSITVGDLQGEYGVAEVPNVADFYNTKPFGIKSTINDMGSSTSTHYGFYDQEFAPMSFDVEDDNRYKYETLMKERDNETPDTVISSSSPECTMWEPLYLYPGLKVINEECDNDEEVVFRSMSPQIPLVAPIPIRLKPGMSAFSRSLDMCNKENEGTKDIFGVKSRFGSPTPLKDNSNVTVTLTLTSSAAEDIMGVLRNLANILHIPAPTAYQIVERTTTPPSQKLGLYRTKGKDGKEGAPIDIQTILNGAAKFCRHCDVVILNSMIRAKASEFPLLTLNNTNELINDTDDLYFCSRSCYKQFQWRPTSILEENRQDTTTKSTNEHEKNLKVDEKTFSDVIMTTSTTCDLNDEDLKMEVDLDETDIKEATSGIDLKELDIKQELRDEGSVDDDDERQSKYKGVRYKMFSNACFAANMIKYKKPTEKEITETLFRMNITVTANKMPEDTRKCIFCHQIGDGVADGPSRLLNFDVDKWVHLNCALWSDGVYETVNGALMNLENALQASLVQTCVMCGNLGATIKCFKTRCTNVYHLNCALKDNCVFYKNKTTMCSSHAPKTEKDNELTTLSVQRRVYVERDESRQVASVMHHSELSNLMRVGSLIFLNVGQLLPHQLIAFHTPNYIYPIGYKIIRFYWSMRQPNRRCRYICSIADVSGRPEFRVLVQESQRDDIELRDSSPRAVWQRILEPLAQMRKENQLIQVFPKYITGEDLFGLTEPAVVRILESLPGIETLTDYRFKYGRNPLLELPLAINPSGAARTEPKLKQSVGWKKPHTQRTGSTSQRPTFVPTASIAGEVACPYSKQFVHSKSSQYKKMKQEWRNNVYLARSKIQGLGLYAARDLEKHTMVIEYIGEVIRTELSESREKQYEAKNRGIYMFRLDEDRVVDATLCGGLARYINHSCNPNCVTEIVEVDRDYRIIIFAKRRINRGEELSYDYKFDIEDDAHKISCMCGAPNCRKWMN